MLTNKTPWVVLLVLWMLGSTWWHVCKIKQLCADDPAPTTFEPADLETGAPAATVKVTPLTIADGDRFRLTFPGNVSFARSGANANLSDLGGNLDSLVVYLKANPGRTLEITGFFAPTEANSTSFENLGVARAEGVKQYLVQQGIPSASLTTKGEQAGDLAFAGDSLHGGLSFVFGGESAPVVASATPVAVDTTTATPPTSTSETTPLPATEEELAAAEKFTSVFEPIDLYFVLGEANYIRTSETKKFFEEAAKYLADHKDKKLVVTGYTDNAGPDDVNLRLSRDRANSVKRSLRKAGIDTKQIDVQAKGEADPKASNDTREGRKANRRVTVVVK